MDKSALVIDVNNNVNLQGASGGTPGTSGQTNASSIWNAFSAQFFLEGARKIIGASGNQQLTQIIGQGSKYGMLGFRIAMSGGTDVLAIATMGLNLASDALAKVNKHDRELAKLRNEIDNARVKAGLLDMSNTTVTTNWWSGRYKYGRG